MGQYADMMLDGTCCACCGEWLGGEGDGFPIYCAGCEPYFLDEQPEHPKPKVNCPECGKRVKAAGVADHRRDVHGITAKETQ